MAKSTEQRKKDAKECMARKRRFMKDNDADGYNAYKANEKERKREERRQIKAQGMTNTAKRKLEKEKNAFEKKFLKAQSKLMETREKYQTRNFHLQHSYSDVSRRLDEIRKGKSCTNAKCKDALLEQIRKVHSHDMSQKNTLHCLEDAHDKNTRLENRNKFLEMQNEQLRAENERLRIQIGKLCGRQRAAIEDPAPLNDCLDYDFSFTKHETIEAISRLSS